MWHEEASFRCGQAGLTVELALVQLTVVLVTLVGVTVAVSVVLKSANILVPTGDSCTGPVLNQI